MKLLPRVFILIMIWGVSVPLWSYLYIVLVFSCISDSNCSTGLLLYLFQAAGGILLLIYPFFILIYSISKLRQDWNEKKLHKEPFSRTIIFSVKVAILVLIASLPILAGINYFNCLRDEVYLEKGGNIKILESVNCESLDKIIKLPDF